MSEMQKCYLGDSVYAEMENGTIKLTTWNGYPDDPRNTIYLEHEVFHNLLSFCEAVRREQETDER